MDFPEATDPIPTRTGVFLAYLDYFRATMVSKIEALPDGELSSSRLPSGWTPLQLLQHLTFVEMRWLEWGFEGRDVADPFGDQRDWKWHVEPGVTREQLVAASAAQAARSRAVIESHDLDEIGQPSDRWDAAEPASLERVLFHLVQEYARHLGHLDIVAELAGGPVGE